MPAPCPFPTLLCHRRGFPPQRRTALLHGEDAPGFDLEEVVSVVDETEVVIVGFPICAERLLIDLRADEASGPLVELVEPLSSATERALWLADRRPALGAPDRSVFFMWPHTVDYLRDSEVITHIVNRARREHGIEFEPEVRGVLTELRDLERDFTRAAVFGGEGFQTVWTRPN